MLEGGREGGREGGKRDFLFGSGRAEKEEEAMRQPLCVLYMKEGSYDILVWVWVWMNGREG